MSKKQKQNRTQAQATHTAALADVDLMALARPVIARLEGSFLVAFREQLIAEINALRAPQTRAQVERAGQVAHEAAAEAYNLTYKRVFRAAMNASR
jgi:hypothetical protein